jgi:hypothetical protein
MPKSWWLCLLHWWVPQGPSAAFPASQNLHGPSVGSPGPSLLPANVAALTASLQSTPTPGASHEPPLTQSASPSPPSSSIPLSLRLTQPAAPQVMDASQAPTAVPAFLWERISNGLVSVSLDDAIFVAFGCRGWSNFQQCVNQVQHLTRSLSYDPTADVHYWHRQGRWLFMLFTSDDRANTFVNRWNASALPARHGVVASIVPKACGNLTPCLPYKRLSSRPPAG